MTKIDMAFKFDGISRDTIQLQELINSSDEFITNRKKLTTSMLENEFNESVSFYDATIFLAMVVKIELFWNVMKSTGESDLVLVAVKDSIMNHESAKNKYPLNEAFMELTGCIIYGKIIIVSKRLLGNNNVNKIIPFQDWGGTNTILQIE